MSFKKVKSDTLYGWATVKSTQRGVQVILRVKDIQASTKDNIVEEKRVFDYSVDEFFEFLPPTVSELGDPNRKYFCAMPASGKTIYQFRPMNMEGVVCRFKGFYRNQAGDIVLNGAYRNEDHLQAIFELQVTQGEWTGVIYPYRYWHVTGKEDHEPIMWVEKGDLNYKYLTKPMRAIIEASGVIERDPTCPLGDTDDPRAILDWLEEEILKDKSVRVAVDMKDGYPNFDHLEVLDTPKEEEKEVDEFEEEASSVAAPVVRKVAKKFDDAE